MRRIERLHPMTLFLTMLCAVLPAMFCLNPIVQLISCLGALLLYLSVRESGRKKEWLWLILFCTVIIVLQPVFHHNGKTVLFYVNQNRITLEAVVYGIVTAFMLAGILIWCKSLSLVMTSDRVVYLVGRISQKAALICSMALQFIPRFRRQMQKIREQQKLLGLYREATLIDRIRGELYIFSATVTWAFEHSMDTADSMQARGYGTGKRTWYTQYYMHASDYLLSVSAIFLTVWIFVAYANGELTVTYYPQIGMPILGAAGWLAYAAYLIVCLLLPGYCFSGTVHERIVRHKSI